MTFTQLKEWPKWPTLFKLSSRFDPTWHLSRGHKIENGEIRLGTESIRQTGWDNYNQWMESTAQYKKCQNKMHKSQMDIKSNQTNRLGYNQWMESNAQYKKCQSKMHKSQMDIKSNQTPVKAKIELGNEVLIGLVLIGFSGIRCWQNPGKTYVELGVEGRGPRKFWILTLLDGLKCLFQRRV